MFNGDGEFKKRRAKARTGGARKSAVDREGHKPENVKRRRIEHGSRRRNGRMESEEQGRG